MTKEKLGYYGSKFSLSLSITSIALCFLMQPSTAHFSFTIEEFTVLTLTQTPTSSSNTIHFDLKLRNLDIEPLYYNALNLTFYYKSNLTSFAIGNATFAPFYQRKLGRDHCVGNFEARGVKWENDTMPLVKFRVELATSVQYQLNAFFWSPKLELVAGADLKVNEEGILVNKGVELTSTAPKNIFGRFEMVIILLGVWLFLHNM